MRVDALRGRMIARHGEQVDALRTKNRQRLRGVDGDVAMGRVVGPQPRRIQRQGAALAAIVLAGAAAQWCVGAMAQVDTHVTRQGQLPGTGIQLHGSPVGAVDDLAVAVHAQHAAMCIEHRALGQGQAIAGGQANAADTLAAGIDQAVDTQMAVVQRHLHLVGAHPVADLQVALLELEAPAAMHAAVVQALVERGEGTAQVTGQPLGTQGETRTRVGHLGAPGIVVAGACAQEAALQVDLAGTGVQRHHLQAAGLVVFGVQVDDRPGRLVDVAVLAAQDHVTAPAVLVQVVEADLAPGQVQLRRLAQAQVALAVEGQLAAGQCHAGVEVDALRAERPFGAQRPGLELRVGGARRRPREHLQGTADAHLVDRAGFTGHQRGAHQQVAAAVAVAFAGHILAA